MTYYKNYAKSRARSASIVKRSALTPEDLRLAELETQRLSVGHWRAMTVGGVIGAGLVGAIVWLVSSLF